MKRFFAERPMVAWFIVAVAATVVSAWIINPPKDWSLTWLIKAAGSVDQATLKLLVAAAILCIGASVTYIAWRLAHGTRTAYAGGNSTSPILGC
jgi:hypothetical protein